jgi:hypothetical protein
MTLTRWTTFAVSSVLTIGACSQSGTADDRSGGGNTSTGGSSSSGGTGPAANGGTLVASGGQASGASPGAVGGNSPSGGGATIGGSASGGDGNGGTAGAPSGNCAPIPTADPAMTGAYETVTEMNVGPLAGEGEDGEPVDFTIFRPADLGANGECHPIITWGNGTGSTPNLYGVLLRHLASHGFVVIASNSPNVAQGSPPPMVAGVTWIIEQNADPSSPYYGRLDIANVGATGHSQGGFATSTAGNDPSIKTIAPLCGAGNPRSLSGPAFLFCGGEDTVVECDGIERTFAAIDDQPAMFANFLAGDHANWLSFGGNNPKPVEVAVTAWMRVHLMNDTALRSWFYGPDCKLCTDEAWEIQQFMMD